MTCRHMMELGDLLESFCGPTQQRLRVTECVSAYIARDMDNVTRTDKREEERRKWKEYHQSVRTYCANVSKTASSKYDHSS